MLNTQITPTSAPATNVDAGMTEGSMGRMENFNTGVNGSKSTLMPPKIPSTDITTPIKTSNVVTSRVR